MAKKQILSDIRYWEKRRELEDKARLKMEDDMIRTLTKNLTEALEKIQAQLLSQADLHNMTQQELLEDYSLRDQKKYKKYIDKNFKELMKSDEKYQEFIDEFFPSYDYAKVNRLLQMRSDIFNTLASEMIKTDPNKKFNDGLEDIINKMYNSNSNALMYLLGPGDFNPLPKKELDNMLNYPWSGKTFSNRLWGNISRLEQNLSNAIVNSVSSGQGVAEALKTMKNDSGISDMFKLEEKKFKNAIENLVRTEYAHFAVTGLRKSMSDAGIKDTQSWSAEDERVCSICGGRHGKVIKDDWHPPYHGKCRCTEIPKMPELGEDIDLLYDEMFGDLLDEFAKDKFGIKLS
ncbi:minor capsid protein [Vagococcus carniphilus]|uniref:minor capsid protein n=1 Tax=Vagococcus carniphilus TaxID=218144 RepID=UPI002892162E|nr:minor capsid protein [Vagococcus carniphilus]MDT2813753.1 minor capsid protein [Vagococcus carniphilus]